LQRARPAGVVTVAEGTCQVKRSTRPGAGWGLFGVGAGACGLEGCYSLTCVTGTS